MDQQKQPAAAAAETPTITPGDSEGRPGKLETTLAHLVTGVSKDTDVTSGDLAKGLERSLNVFSMAPKEDRLILEVPIQERGNTYYVIISVKRQ